MRHILYKMTWKWGKLPFWLARKIMLLGISNKWRGVLNKWGGWQIWSKITIGGAPIIRHRRVWAFLNGNVLVLDFLCTFIFIYYYISAYLPVTQKKGIILTKNLSNLIKICIFSKKIWKHWGFFPKFSQCGSLFSCHSVPSGQAKGNCCVTVTDKYIGVIGNATILFVSCLAFFLASYPYTDNVLPALLFRVARWQGNKNYGNVQDFLLGHQMSKSRKKRNCHNLSMWMHAK